MSENNFEPLKLENQMCFPLYAAAREVVKLYRPHLDKINLTYTQYIAMMVLWEQEQCSVKELGQKLYLDSGTLTPVLKSLEQKGFIRRFRSESDERVLLVELTKDGEKLKKSGDSKALENEKKFEKTVRDKKNEKLMGYVPMRQYSLFEEDNAAKADKKNGKN